MGRRGLCDAQRRANRPQALPRSGIPGLRYGLSDELNVITIRCNASRPAHIHLQDTFTIKPFSEFLDAWVQSEGFAITMPFVFVAGSSITMRVRRTFSELQSTCQVIKDFPLGLTDIVSSCANFPFLTSDSISTYSYSFSPVEARIVHSARAEDVKKAQSKAAYESNFLFTLFAFGY
jgi:hypothetical protein